jgi:hypothetical protein
MPVESISKAKIIVALLIVKTIELAPNVYLIQDQHLIMTKVRLFFGQIFRGKFFCKVSAVAPVMVLEVLATYAV